PQIIKQRMVARYASAFGIHTLIETGTFYGDMVHAMRRRFRRIVSIELSQDLFNKAKLRFRTHPHVELLQGDSGDLLPSVLAKVSEPCLFWLDGHYSEGDTAKGEMETPILRELNTILCHG